MNIAPIEGYAGYYICDNGKAYCDLPKRSRRTIENPYNYIPEELREVSPRLTSHGYARIYARNNKTWKRDDLYIHRLVAKYFVQNPDPDKYKYVNHKNCIRNDNRAENLEWCTAKENTAQTERIGHIVHDELGRYKSNFNYVIV